MHMTRRLIITAAGALALSAAAQAQTKWDLPAAYPATNFHTVNLQQFADDIDKASSGKLKITVHANASLFKAPEIKRAVQGGQAQLGEILLVNFQNEWQIFGADGIPFLADSYDEAVKLWRALCVAAPAGAQAGTILAVDAAGVHVACGEAALCLTHLQRAGGKRLAAADFLRGFPLAPGQRFGSA